jgi:hypothetical protein
MDKKESRPGKDGSKQKYEANTYYRLTKDGQKEFRLPPGEPVILCARESEYYPEWRRYIQDQFDEMRRAFEPSGHPVHREFKDVEPGWKIRRPGLQEAYEEHLRTGYPIAFLNLNRALRPKEFHPSRNPNAKLSARKIEKFLSVYPGIHFILVEPDEEIRSRMTKRGQASTGHRGGGDHRPGYKKRFREKWLEPVLELRQMGFGYGMIAKISGVKKPTVQKWVKTRI